LSAAGGAGILRRMEPLTLDTLKALATLEGLELTDQELAALLPLVAAARSTLEPLGDALAGEHEPATQYRIL
jgi:hypothetical protein